MPNYLPEVHLHRQCGNTPITVWQSPTYGTWLTQPGNNAKIGLLTSWQLTDLLFTVNLVDSRTATNHTCSSVPTPSRTVLSNSSKPTTEQLEKNNCAIYNIADRIFSLHGRREARKFPNSQIPDSIPVDEDYWNNTLVCWTDPGHAFTGEGMRVWTFAAKGDTLIIR
jgi:hypothetical protein